MGSTWRFKLQIEIDVIEGGMRKLPLFILALGFVFQCVAAAQVEPVKEPSAIRTIREMTAGMKRMNGLIPLDWDEKNGKLFMEIPRIGADGKSADYLYATSLPFGTGSNDLGRDRG